MKSNLRNYVARYGKITKQNKFRCPNHDDEKPSCILYDKTESVYCPVCGFKGDIFDVCGKFERLEYFLDQKKFLEGIYGKLDARYDSSNNNNNVNSTDKNRKKQSSEMIKSYDYEECKTLYSKKIKYDERYFGAFFKAWKYLDKSGKVTAVDARFEKDGRKSVITYWIENDKVVRKGNRPNVIYNFDKINDYENILIVEGAKCAESANELLENFCVISWNGGTGNVKNIDWSVLMGKNVYILPDNDHPGKDTAEYIKEKTNGKIVDIPDCLKDKEDIYDLIHSYNYSPQSLSQLVLGSEKTSEKLTEVATENSSSNRYYKPLGIGDDTQAYFVDSFGHLFSTRIEQLTQQKLLRLAPLQYWIATYGDGLKIKADGWMTAYDNIIRECCQLDFDMDNIRGRGAWREKDGRICYNDGKNIIGEYDEGKVFLRKSKIDIGLNDTPADIEIRKNMFSAARETTVETELDAIRLLGWSAISPFSGALPWRPSVMLSGESGSGKTNLYDLVVTPLSAPRRFVGGTTVAGLRSKLGGDSIPVAIDEAEGDNEKDKQLRNEYFQMMRVSTSDDTPDLVKGTATGGSVSYRMKNAFLFNAIDPVIENAADQKRIFFINLIDARKSGKNKTWKETKKKILSAFTEKNCRAVRSYVWKNIDKILNDVELICDVIEDYSGIDRRTAHADSIMFSAWMNVFTDIDVNEKNIEILVKKYYSTENYETRDDTEEMIEKIFDFQELHADDKIKYTYRELALMVKNKTRLGSDIEIIDSDLKEYNMMLQRNGIKILKNGEIFIANNHPTISRITGKNHGYHKILQRHSNCIEKSKPVSIAGKTSKGVVLSPKDILVFKEEFEDIIPF